jgi:hypothetical protein
MFQMLQVLHLMKTSLLSIQQLLHSLGQSLQHLLSAMGPIPFFGSLEKLIKSG